MGVGVDSPRLQTAVMAIDGNVEGIDCGGVFVKGLDAPAGSDKGPSLPVGSKE